MFMPKQCYIVWLFIISPWVLLSLNVNLRLRTKDLQCRRVIDFYLAHNIGKESIFKGVVVYDAVVGEYF